MEEEQPSPLTAPIRPSPMPLPFREDCWSEGASATLIEAWGDRYLELNRGNLRQKHWKEVADAVNSRSNGVKSRRTDVQCKNRLDTLKKKFKVEKARVQASNGAFTSKWPFYNRIDELIGSSKKPQRGSSPPSPPSPTFALPLTYRNPNPNPNPNSVRHTKRPAVDDAFFRRNSGHHVDANSGSSRSKMSPESSESCRNSVDDGFRELARAIVRFGEIYEKIEAAKQRQMMDLEKQKMEFAKGLEFQRMQLFMDTQVQLEKMKRAKRGGNNADVLYDLGTGLEVLSPLCPHLFLEVAGLGNFAKGMAVVAARATRLPIYSSFAKEGNLSDIFAKGEAISTLFNVVGMGAGIQLATTICSSIEGKLVVGPLLSIIHIYSVVEEMRAAPINTLNPQRTAMIVADFLKTGNVSSPADLRYRENLFFPNRVIEDAGSVKVGRPLRNVVKKPLRLRELQEMFPKEKFLIVCENKWTDIVLEYDATGEDALRGWLIAGLAADMDKTEGRPSTRTLCEAYEKVGILFPSLILKLKEKGWHTDRFLDGTGSRFALRNRFVV